MKTRKEINKRWATSEINIAVWILIFSILDAFFTDLGIRQGWVEEANPFAKSLYEWSVIAFYGWKLVLPSFLVALYPKINNNTWIKKGMIIVFLIYLAIILYHFLWIGIVLVAST